jgi:hypothetical protein
VTVAVEEQNSQLHGGNMEVVQMTSHFQRRCKVCRAMFLSEQMMREAKTICVGCRRNIIGDSYTRVLRSNEQQQRNMADDNYFESYDEYRKYEEYVNMCLQEYGPH